MRPDEVKFAMSYSQKFSGKLLVPWFNSSEWKLVCDNLSSGKPENLKEALKIIKIWKLRTPLLSAGVEGTLIILSALFPNEDVGKKVFPQIQALALLRFLNLCAANNDKQGTFYRTASKNELPKWLIDLRHDIAHGHKLPSESFIKLALEKSYQWLLEKYWNVQNDELSDYIISGHENSKLTQLVETYVGLRLRVFSGDDISERDTALMGKINYFVTKRHKKPETSIQGVLEILEEMINQSYFEEDDEILDKVAKSVAENALLSVACERTTQGLEIVSQAFRDIWLNLLNILLGNKKFIYYLFYELLETTKNTILSDQIRKIASLWIREIFLGLTKLQIIFDEYESKTVPDFKVSHFTEEVDNKYPEYKDCINFEVTEKIIRNSYSESIEVNALTSPNIYTLDYLECILKYNKRSEEYIKDCIKLVECVTSLKEVEWKQDEIFTVDDLHIVENNENDDTEMMEDDIHHVGNEHNRSTKCVQIIDTIQFEGCPLGILPHQLRDRNPLLASMC